MKTPFTFIVSETYETVTPESAEHGDAADRGFNFEDREYTLDELADYLKSEGYIFPSSSHVTSKGDWISSSPAQDRNYFEKGEETTTSLHLKDILDADNSPVPDDIQNKLWTHLITTEIHKSLGEELTEEDVFDM